MSSAKKKLIMACCCGGEVIEFLNAAWSQDFLATAAGYGEVTPPDVPDGTTFDEAWGRCFGEGSYDMNIGPQQFGLNWMDNITFGGPERYYLNGYARYGSLDTSSLASASAATLKVTPSDAGGNNWSSTVSIGVRVRSSAFTGTWATMLTEGEDVGEFDTTGDGTLENLVLPAAAVAEINLTGTTYFAFYITKTTKPSDPGEDQFYRRKIDFSLQLDVTGTLD
ncbi:MAG TPA: hypothetical protein VMW52_10070 [Phycisphaerae bacterium]|nr:hypothetical protein [Phycisphaerae bacterium]